MHTGENIKFLTEQSLQTLFALVGGVDLNASIFDHSQLIFELFCVSRVVIHELLQPAYFGGIAFETLTDLVFETLNFDILVEVRQQVLYLDHFALLSQLDHIAYPSFFDQKVFGDLDP